MINFLLALKDIRSVYRSNNLSRAKIKSPFRFGISTLISSINTDKIAILSKLVQLTTDLEVMQSQTEYYHYDMDQSLTLIKEGITQATNVNLGHWVSKLEDYLETKSISSVYIQDLLSWVDRNCQTYTLGKGSLSVIENTKLTVTDSQGTQINNFAYYEQLILATWILLIIPEILCSFCPDGAIISQQWDTLTNKISSSGPNILFNCMVSKTEYYSTVSLECSQLFKSFLDELIVEIADAGSSSSEDFNTILSAKINGTIPAIIDTLTESINSEFSNMLSGFTNTISGNMANIVTQVCENQIDSLSANMQAVIGLTKTLSDNIVSINEQVATVDSNLASLEDSIGKLNNIIDDRVSNFDSLLSLVRDVSNKIASGYDEFVELALSASTRELDINIGLSSVGTATNSLNQQIERLLESMAQATFLVNDVNQIINDIGDIKAILGAVTTIDKTAQETANNIANLEKKVKTNQILDIAQTLAVPVINGMVLTKISKNKPKL